MIEARTIVPYESYWVGQEIGRRRGELIYRRVLLRPHGSGGDIVMHIPQVDKPWMINYRGTLLVERFATRAQAAQAVYEGGR